MAVALDGDCLADVGMLRAEPAVFGPVASDPTVSRLVNTLAASGEKALRAIRAPRAEARRRAWRLADGKAPDAGRAVTVDLDGVLVIAHSDKEDAAPTWKRAYGHHPLMGFVDHGQGGTGEPVAALLRPGNAGSNTAADHITAARLTLAQLPKTYRRGCQTLIRRDSAGGTHDFVAWLAQRGRWLSYPIGMVITDTIHQHVLKVPAPAWTAAVEADGKIRDGAWVTELTGDVLDGWPKGMRLIVRKERPHPGAQLRFTDADGMRLACFSPPTPWAGRSPNSSSVTACGHGPTTASGLPGPPACGISLCTAQNRIWLEIVQIALDLLAWMPMLALTGTARLWEPRRLRLRLFTTAGQLVTTGRRRILRLARHCPWTSHITTALERLALLPNPG
ncbi:transposase [Streptomyces phaeochromogenes]|uniref:transposase n=1 Tax=Streptomyces phaeochromogenes TaxID=1923 RepID=UPI003863CA4D|nr:transposase [Streptomyces phaeochromogenes]